MFRLSGCCCISRHSHSSAADSRGSKASGITIQSVDSPAREISTGKAVELTSIPDTGDSVRPLSLSVDSPLVPCLRSEELTDHIGSMSLGDDEGILSIVQQKSMERERVIQLFNNYFRQNPDFNVPDDAYERAIIAKNLIHLFNGNFDQFERLANSADGCRIFNGIVPLMAVTDAAIIAKIWKKMGTDEESLKGLCMLGDPQILAKIEFDVDSKDSKDKLYIKDIVKLWKACGKKVKSFNRILTDDVVTVESIKTLSIDDLRKHVRDKKYEQFRAYIAGVADLDSIINNDNSSAYIENLMSFFSGHLNSFKEFVEEDNGCRDIVRICRMIELIPIMDLSSLWKNMGENLKALSVLGSRKVLCKINFPGQSASAENKESSENKLSVNNVIELWKACQGSVACFNSILSFISIENNMAVRFAEFLSRNQRDLSLKCRGHNEVEIQALLLNLLVSIDRISLRPKTVAKQPQRRHSFNSGGQSFTDRRGTPAYSSCRPYSRGVQTEQLARTYSFRGSSGTEIGLAPKMERSKSTSTRSISASVRASDNPRPWRELSLRGDPRLIGGKPRFSSLRGSQENSSEISRQPFFRIN